MRILALEFSSPRRSVAFLDDQTGAAGEVARGPLPTSVAAAAGPRAPAGGRRTEAFALLDELFRRVGLEPAAIECLAIGLGPGSYTGVRAAIAIAQGWQLGTGVRLLGVRSIDCLAAQSDARQRGPVVAVIDAQQNEFYLATYERAESGWRELAPLRLAPVAEVRGRLARGEVLLGPDLPSLAPHLAPTYPSAAALARLAAGRSDFVSGECLEPVYLRPVRFVKAPPPRFPTAGG